MLVGSSDINQEEADNQENNTPATQDASTQSAKDMVTISKQSMKIIAFSFIIIIVILIGGIVFTAKQVNDLTEELHTDGFKTFPSLSRKEGIVPTEVWNWIVEAKADMTFNPHSAHYLLKVSSDGKSLYQASLSSPPRVPTDETYLVCICVSSKRLLHNRSYYELRVTWNVPWTLGLRIESFNADTTPDTYPDNGIWTIASTQGKIIIHDRKGPQTLHFTPSRIGLYLDYSQGQVSFYDVIMRRHLHTYLTTFKENLHFYASVQVPIEETQEVLISFV